MALKGRNLPILLPRLTHHTMLEADRPLLIVTNKSTTFLLEGVTRLVSCNNAAYVASNFSIDQW